MKYPATQFETLKKALIILNEYFDLYAMHESNLHYLVYQQFSEGQTHNALYVNDKDEIKRFHKLDKNDNGFRKLVVINEPFELYPNDCNDTHIITAIKKAMKEAIPLTIANL